MLLVRAWKRRQRRFELKKRTHDLEQRVINLHYDLYNGIHRKQLHRFISEVKPPYPFGNRYKYSDYDHTELNLVFANSDKQLRFKHYGNRRFLFEVSDRNTDGSLYKYSSYDLLEITTADDDTVKTKSDLITQNQDIWYSLIGIGEHIVGLLETAVLEYMNKHDLSSETRKHHNIDKALTF